MKSDRHFKFILLFSFLYCIFCYTLAVHWYKEGYFSIQDVFFDANAKMFVSTFAHGIGLHAISHAFLELFAVPIIVIVKTYGIIFDNMTQLEARGMREMIALFISPVFSSLTLIAAYKTLALLNIKPLEASVFTLIFAGCFTNIIFAVVPESYALSCFLISLLIYYFFKQEKSKCTGNNLIWFCLAILLAGTTITNVCTFGIVFFFHLLKNERLHWLEAAKKSSLYSTLALSAVIFFYKVSHFLLDVKTGYAGSIDYISKFTSLSLSTLKSNIFNLFGASINSFAGLTPKTKPSIWCEDFISASTSVMSAFHSLSAVKNFSSSAILNFFSSSKEDSN